jgi:GT2 family glycosyltransferase
LNEYSAAHPSIRSIPLGANRGFAAGNNVAARQARGEFLVFLNVDTCVTQGWVERLIRRCHRDTRIGIAVPVTNWAGNEAKIDFDYTDVQEMEEFALRLAMKMLGTETELAVAPLFCALVPRRVWEAAGELDERYAVGMFEDDDFSLRVKKLGFRIVAAEDCFVHHFGKASFNALPADVYKAIFEQNLKRFEEKWQMRWAPHRFRAGVRPEHVPFEPEEFTDGTSRSTTR